MDINERILSELQQINLNLTKIMSALSDGTRNSMVPDKSRIGSEIEDRIRKMRQEAESKMLRLKAGSQVL